MSSLCYGLVWLFCVALFDGSFFKRNVFCLFFVFGCGVALLLLVVGCECLLLVALLLGACLLY